MSEAPSPRLPQELINHVISFLWDWPGVLDECKLISRECYSYVSTFSGVLKLGSARTFSVLSSSPSAAEKLRDVHFLQIRDSATPWLYRIPLLLGPELANVAFLYMLEWSPVLTPLHPAVLLAFAHLRSVRELFITKCRFESIAQLQRLLGAFPGLRALELREVYVPAHKPSKEGASAVICKLPPRLTYLSLGTSCRKKPLKGDANVAGALAAWFTRDHARTRELQKLRVRISLAHVHEGELASIGQLITAVGPHITWLALDFDGNQNIDSPAHVVDWSSVRLDSCVRVQTLRIHRSSPDLHELALLSPDCRITSLIFAQGMWYRERQATDWLALARALEGSAYNTLERVVNEARTPQSPAEAKALEVFIKRMHARGIKFEDRTKHPYLWDK